MHRFTTTLGIALAAVMVCPSAQAACEDYSQELATMVSADQALRKRLDFDDQHSPAQQKLQKNIVIVDRANTARLKALIERCGWPDKDKVGEATVHHAWLLTQHADLDIAFQKHALDLIEKDAARRGEPLGSNFAYLYDRVATAEQRPQRYGTQFMMPVDDPCKFELFPLDDRRQVEARRAAIGLPPLAQYEQQMRETANCAPDKPAA